MTAERGGGTREPDGAAAAGIGAVGRGAAGGAVRQRCVLVLSGADPSGGAGIAADILAIHAQGAHALPVITALTVQDNDRVHAVQPVAPELVLRQARALIARIRVDAVKIGIPGSAANARAIAQLIAALRADAQPHAVGADADTHAGAAGPAGGRELAVVLDPVLASGHGDLLSRDDAVQALAVLLPLVTVITPNGPEAQALAAQLAPSGGAPAQADTPGQAAAIALAGEGAGSGAVDGSDSGAGTQQAAQSLLALGCRHVLVTGGHGGGDTVVNRWFSAARSDSWAWPRLPGEFHGSGCTLAAAIAALLALGWPVEQALARAQAYCHGALADAYAIAPGQRIPRR